MKNPGSPLSDLLVGMTALAMSASILHAQTAQTPSRTVGSDPANPRVVEESVTLSPFEVNTSADRGYVATNTLAGGRLNTGLMETPASITVLTREFLDDLGGSDFRGALEYAPNAIPVGETDVTTGSIGSAAAGAPDSEDNPTQVRIRGVGSSRVTRNYFVWQVNSDNYNTERLDLARGPNTLIFGDSGSGGVANVTTKQARFDRSFLDINVRTINYGGGRVTFDYNQPINDKIALRINALKADEQGWRDFERLVRDGFFATGTYKPFDRTQIRADFEWGDNVKYAPSNAIRDNFSSWDGSFVANGPLTTNPAASTGTQRFIQTSPRTGPSEYLVMINGYEQFGFMNFANFLRTTGNGSSIEPRLSPAAPAGAVPLVLDGRAAGTVANGTRYYGLMPNRAYSITPSDRTYQTDYWAASFIANHQVGQKLHFELGYAHQQRYMKNTPQSNPEIYLDVNTVLPNGQANPFFLMPYYQIHTNGYRLVSRDADYDEIRLSGLYQLHTALTQQNLGFFVSKRWDNTTQRVFRTKRINGQNLANANINTVFYRTYLNNRGAPNPIDSTRTGLIGGVELGLIETGGGGGPGFRDESDNETAQLFATGSWFDSRRLKSIAGVRWDRAYSARFNPVLDPVTGLRTHRDDYTLGSERTTSQTSPTAGVVYNLRPDLAVYLNYAKSFLASSGGNTRLDGSIVDPRIGTGKEGGVKFALLDGRISGSLAYYDQTEENNTLTVLTNNPSELLGVSSVSLGVNFNNIATALGRPAPFPSNYTETQDLRGKGFEFEATANLTSNWSLLANISFPEVATENALPDSRAYLAANRAEWLSAAAAIGPATATAVQNEIDTIEFQLSQFPDGRDANGTVKHTANFFTRYRFSQGALEGITVGIGANYRGDRVAGLNEGRPIYSNSYVLVNALIGYDTRIRNKPVKLQVNISNLFDEGFQRYSAYRILDGAISPFNFTQQAPRRIQVTANVRF